MCTEAFTKQEVSKPLKVAAPGTKFMVRTQQRANKQGSVGWSMNTNFTTINQRLPHETAGKCLIAETLEQGGTVV